MGFGIIRGGGHVVAGAMMVVVVAAVDGLLYFSFLDHEVDVGGLHFGL